jgi:hypothetical protein
MVGPDGALYIFMIGSDTIGEHGPVMIGRADPAVPRAGHGSEHIGELEGGATTREEKTRSEHRGELEWEWITPDFHDLNGSLIAKDNPTAVMYGNGSVLLATRGIALFMAQSWKGPYIMRRYSVIIYSKCTFMM